VSCSLRPCGEGSQTGDGITGGNKTAGSRKTSKPRLGNSTGDGFFKGKRRRNIMAARGVNRVTLVGNLGQDPEIRYMPQGGAVANITLATSDSWRDKQTGEMRESVEWHRVVLFGKLAEIAGEYLRKGAQVYIEGELRTRKWTDQTGHGTSSAENSHWPRLGQASGNGRRIADRKNYSGNTPFSRTGTGSAGL